LFVGLFREVIIVIKGKIVGRARVLKMGGCEYEHHDISEKHIVVAGLHLFKKSMKACQTEVTVLTSNTSASLTIMKDAVKDSVIHC
jgi:hypothetical protein